jgi:class 3 adenylate cyclase/tetratricopeptide (TPR) repeat protein
MTALTCPSCGRDVAADFRVCPYCAAPLAQAPPAREERKVVTVLFADLAGFTSRAERLDPEEVRAILRPYHERLRSDLERFGGTVEKFIGDAVMAVFGAPVAHEDDPERAVRAALAIRDALADEGQLHVRIGITTGDALVSLGARPEAGEGMVAGDVVNTAARLQAAAPVDGILVDEATYRATERGIAYRAHEPVAAKGKEEPVAVHEAAEPRTRFGVDVRQVGGAELVGRADDLEALHAAFARARRSREPQLVTVVGVPGIGKSRLVWELFRRLDAEEELVAWRQGRSLPYGEGISFWALGEMTKAQAGILETDAPETVAEKLAGATAPLIADDSERLWVESHLRPLVGLEAEREVAGDRRAEAFAAWRRFLEALAEHRPLVLVFEDLHWADEGLLDFVDHLVDWATGVPLLVVGTARPELLARRPGWGGGKSNALTISLRPLSDEETARLVQSLIERSVMPADVQASLLERAGGNPLYAEEFVRLLSQRRDAVALPESVQGIIAARIDGLGSDEKQLLQEAAVLGKVFWLGGLGRERWRAEELLHALERKEFVRRERRSSVSGEVEYAFRHALVREVAYEQIPRAERASRHVAAADWIESLGRPDDHAEMLAHHFVSALEYAPARNDDATLFARAAAALRDAGDRAFSLNAFVRAASFYERALELDAHPTADVGFRLGHALHLVGDPRSRDVLEHAAEEMATSGNRELAAEANALLAEGAWHRGERDRTVAYVERALELIRGAPPSRARARVLAEASRVRMLAGHAEEAIATAREAFELAESLGLTELAARALNNVGVAKTSLGDVSGVADLERSVELALSVSSPEAARGYNNLGAVLFDVGDVQRSAECFEEAVRTGERLGNAVIARYARGVTVNFPFVRGDVDEALARAEELIAEFDAGNPHYLEPSIRHLRAEILLGRDADPGEVLAETRRGLEKARGIGDPQTIVPALGFTAQVHVRLGQDDEAREILDELLSSNDARPLLGRAQYFLPAVLVAEQLGRADELRRLVAGAPPSPWRDAHLAFLEGDADRAADAYGELDSAWSETAARLHAARKLVSSGRGAEAEGRLRDALAFFRKVGARRYVREVEALIEEAAGPKAWGKTA